MSACVVEYFQRYRGHGGLTVSRAEFEANLAAKFATAAFQKDVQLLVSADVACDPEEAANLVLTELVSRLPGDPWKGLER